MNFLDYLPLLAGIGLFLYGMDLLGKSLERLAGAKMEKTLEKLTDSPVKGVLLGTGVTAVIQSSSATTIMVIGLLNAGVFKLSQAFPVIMGANIGTTVTGQLLRLGDISGNSGLLLSLLKPSSFGPVMIAVGACLVIFSKKISRRLSGNLLIGLGMLFFGMYTMETTLAPLSETPWFRQMVVMIGNPVVGILIGAVMTAILQSSSASVGVLQALSATGTITWAAAIPLILGQNIGKCVIVILATLKSNKDSKRAVFLHLTLNMIGLIIFSAVIYGVNAFHPFGFWEKVVNRGNIADFHTVFSIVTVLLVLPFYRFLIDFSNKVIPERQGEQSLAEQELAQLNDYIIQTPSIAIAQARKVVVQMGTVALKSFDLVRALHEHYTEEGAAELEQQEDFLDRAENALNNYLLQVTPHRMTMTDSNMCSEMLHTIVNFERIGDHCINILDVARFNFENNVGYSEFGWIELNKILDASREILETTVKFYTNNDPLEATHISPYEDVVDLLQEQLKDRHVERLRLGLCNVSSGISFLEVISNLERISDHCANIAKNILQANSKDSTHYAFHAGAKLEALQAQDPDYQVHRTYFLSRYSIPEDARAKAAIEEMEAENRLNENQSETDKKEDKLKKSKKQK